MIAPSFWWADLGGMPEARAALPGPMEVDVAIVGGGYTGLWTAWYLLEADPSLRVVVLERERAGFGASGRNGGWLSGLWPGPRDAATQDAIDRSALAAELADTRQTVRAEKIGEVAAEFDAVHSIQRAVEVGSVDAVIKAAELRPRIIGAIENSAAWSDRGSRVTSS